jgi:hypothetical protein
MHNLQIGTLSMRGTMAERLTRRRTGGWRPRRQFKIPERTQAPAQNGKADMYPSRKPAKQADMGREQERARA